MKNKPFGEVETETALITSLVVKIDTNADDITAETTLPSNETAYDVLKDITTKNEKINIVFDGITYEFPNGFDVTEEIIEGVTTCYIGNRGLYRNSSGELMTPELDNGMPFLIKVTYFQVMFYGIDDEEHTISMYHYPKAITPLDSKYLNEALQFGEKVIETIVIEEAEYTAKSMGGQDYFDVIMLEEVVPNETYRVVLNGVEYEVIANEDGKLRFGINPNDNSALYGIETNYFIKYDYNDGQSGAVYTLAVYKRSISITPIDEKYIPESVKGGRDVLMDDNFEDDDFVECAKKYIFPILGMLGSDGEGNPESYISRVIGYDIRMRDLYEDGNVVPVLVVYSIHGYDGSITTNSIQLTDEQLEDINNSWKE